MDPTACYSDMMAAWYSDQRDTGLARECALALMGWLDSGGFAPTGIGPHDARTQAQSIVNQTLLSR